MTFEYNALRTLVDSWGLLAMGGFFLVACGMVFLPSARSGQDEASQIPFKED